MTTRDFNKWFGAVSQLSRNQRKKCFTELRNIGVRREQPVPKAVAEATPENCPHCHHTELGKWGYASGLRRWRCKGCGRTFNALTKTPLARLRNKEKWLQNAEAMINGHTIVRTAEICDIHPNTAFRWRHRFLKLHQDAQAKDLSGIAESDVTYFYKSAKGSRNLNRKPRRRGGEGIGKGFTHDLVSVITLRARGGKGAERVALDHCQPPALDLFKTHLNKDALLLTDGDRELCAAARTRNSSAHIRLKAKRARGVKGSPYHIQTVNAFHSHLKNWMLRFHGVATKYLANYLGWHRHLYEKSHQNDPNLFIQLAFSPLRVNQQLTVK